MQRCANKCTQVDSEFHVPPSRSGLVREHRECWVRGGVQGASPADRPEKGPPAAALLQTQGIEKWKARHASHFSTPPIVPAEATACSPVPTHNVGGRTYPAGLTRGGSPCLNQARTFTCWRACGAACRPGRQCRCRTVQGCRAREPREAERKTLRPTRCPRPRAHSPHRS